MALADHDPDAPEFTRRFVNLADARLGACTLAVSDEFFAASARMLDPRPPQFVPGKYDAHGKWMDGWESRRRRGPGHDWCVVRLGRPGRLHGVDLDTRHFTGNFPPAASIDACRVEHGDPGADTVWQPLLLPVNLAGDRHHYLALDSSEVWSHLRLNLFPDGGIARLRVYGRPSPESAHADADGLIDLAAAVNGGIAIAANNQHFGAAANLLLPGRGVDMGDGWETRRRREPGNDWCLLELARPGLISRIEVDTCHFRGNFPERCSLQAAMVADGTVESLVTQSMFWPPLLAEQVLRADHQHWYEAEIAAHHPISHVRFNILPDGGVSRLRLWGRPA
jgi:allantoicase